MRASKGRVPTSSRQRIRRISSKKAAEILQSCDETLAQSREILVNISRVGFGQLLAVLGDDILRLAIQPDSWGERMRARLISDIAPALQDDVDGKFGVSVEDIAHCASILMPCLLLELGRRSGHIQIEFPSDPTNSSARFRFSVGAGRPVHSIENRQLLFLSSRHGADLVGLCLFGDQQSSNTIERALKKPQDAGANSPNSSRYKQ